MSNQIHPYDPELAARFMNLAMAAEAHDRRGRWDRRAESELEPFGLPLDSYQRLFSSSSTRPDAVKAAVDGPIRAEYEFVGAIRVGHRPVADWGEGDDEPSTLWAADGFDEVAQVLSWYRRRWTENISNTVRYSRSNSPMGFALRSRADGHGVVVLRGTMNLEEWLNNLNYRLTPFRQGDEGLGTVHRGFRHTYKGLRGRYRELVDGFDDDTMVYLVGHSLGAGVSTLAALDVAERRPARASNLQAYLFGAPRVGDATFAAAYDRLVATSYRIVNMCDIVPYVPFEEAGTVVEALGYPYADTKGEMAFVHQAGNPIANHIAAYHLATRDRLPRPAEPHRQGA